MGKHPNKDNAQPSRIIPELKAQDPFNTGSKNVYLTGVKVAAGNIPSCPAPFKDDVVYPQEWRFGDGIEFDAFNGRTQTAQLCTYRNKDPTRALVTVEAVNTSDANWPGKYLTAAKIPDEKTRLWYANNNFDTIQNAMGSNHGKAFVVGRPQDGTNPPKDNNFYHSVFAYLDSCPTWAPAINSRFNLNLNSKGGWNAVVCGQKYQDVLDCCMGRKAGTDLLNERAGTCRADQFKQSAFCDNFMIDYCSKHPSAPECKCIMKPDAARLSATLDLPSPCWYKGCDDRDKVYVTGPMASVVCPPLNLTICTMKPQEVLLMGTGNQTIYKQNCGSSSGSAGKYLTSVNGGPNVESDVPTMSPKDQLRDWILANKVLFGSGISLFILTLLLVVLLVE